MKLNKNVLVGVLVGVVLVLGVQWGVGEYNDGKNAEKIEAFLSGYENAADKTAYVSSYDYSKGIEVSVSTSSASEQNCESIRQDLRGVQDMTFNFLMYVMEKYPPIDGVSYYEQETDEERASFDQLIAEQDHLLERLHECEKKMME